MTMLQSARMRQETMLFWFMLAAALSHRVPMTLFEFRNKEALVE